MAKNIILIGFMGAGKTTVGRQLSKRLGMKFTDTDAEIEHRTGVTIPLIFEIEGEESFRKRETALIKELSQQSGRVIATGGGAVIKEENRRYLKEAGTVIYLRTSVSNILQRTMHDRNRPLLKAPNKKERIEKLTKEREPFYEAIADIVIDTGRQSVHAVIEAIEAALSGKKPQAKPQQKPGQNQNRNDARGAKFKNPAVKRLTVPLGARSYPIEIGPGLLNDDQLFARVIRENRVAVITNTVVGPLYLDKLTETLKRAKKEVISLVLPDGESEKNFESLMKIFDFLLQNRCDRKTVLVALGGGVIGDITGYAAASFMRGVPFVQVPTTLLAEVDSSVGGKTAINHPLGKNMIGAFYQPKAVIADTSTLSTLNDRELKAGIAEVIKYGAITDAQFFRWLEEHMDQLVARDETSLAYAIERSCRIKAQIVREDEKESRGIRETLNFGHTFGHAIEAGMGYGAWLHGEAVAAGMVMASDLSARLGLIDGQTASRVRALIEKAGLPADPPVMDASRWVDLMMVDKKNAGGQIRFIVLEGLGKTRITAVEPAVLSETLAAFKAG